MPEFSLMLGKIRKFGKIWPSAAVPTKLAHLPNKNAKCAFFLAVFLESGKNTRHAPNNARESRGEREGARGIAREARGEREGAREIARESRGEREGARGIVSRQICLKRRGRREFGMLSGVFYRMDWTKGSRRLFLCRFFHRNIFPCEISEFSVS